MTYEQTGLNPLIVFMNSQFNPLDMEELEGYIKVKAYLGEIAYTNELEYKAEYLTLSPCTNQYIEQYFYTSDSFKLL